MKHSMLILAIVVFVSSCSKKSTPESPPAGTLSITSISPDYGKAGTEIIITGTEFSATAADNLVTLGGKTATVTAVTATQLKITVPADATHGKVDVKVGANLATSAMFYYEPIVSSLSATSGKIGDVIVITGQHFGTTATDFEVKFNGTPGEITAATATTLSVKVPTDATAGLITVARKTKPPVNGPTFAIGGGTGETATGFAINDESVTITKLLTDEDDYGNIICMTVDEARNVVYAATRDHILKIDLATKTVSAIIENSTYLNLSLGNHPSAMDVDATGKLYVLASLLGALPATGGNIFIIDPVAKTATLAANRFVGWHITPNGSFALNAPFMVMDNGEIITFDQSNRELCKFSADLSVRTVIYTLPLVLESFVQLIKVDANTTRIVLAGLSNKYYYDYSGTLGQKTAWNAPTGYNMISQTIGGANKYGVAGEIIVDPNNSLSGQQRTTYTVGRLNTVQTSWEKKGSFIIESLNEINTVKYYNFIGLNGKNYFYADKNGNMYAHILGSAAGAGIYKIALN